MLRAQKILLTEYKQIDIFIRDQFFFEEDNS